MEFVSGTEEMEEKIRASFFTKRYFVHFKKENVPVRSHYVICANIERLFSLPLSAKVEMCDDGKKNVQRETTFVNGMMQTLLKSNRSKQCF